MGLFRRGGKDAAADEALGTADAAEASQVDELDEVVELEEVDTAEPFQRTGGPWDADEVADDVVRVDLGAIRVPGVQGMELRMEIDKATDTVSAASILLDGSSLQVQAFAAPRTDGIWDEIRAEIAESVTQQGGSVDDLPGPFGRELLARLPIRTPEGRTGHRPARFLGADGPRWFVRGVDPPGRLLAAGPGLRRPPHGRHLGRDPCRDRRVRHPAGWFRRRPAGSVRA